MLFDQRVGREAALPESGTNDTVRAESVFTAKGSQEDPYDLWKLPPQGSLPLHRLDSPKPWTNPRRRRPTSSQSSLPFEVYKTRVARRKVIALLATGGMIAASTAFAIHLTGDLFSQGLNGNGQQARINNSANLAKNAAMNFVNSDGKAITLVHLTNGNFVAYDRHCSHRGVYVHYDPALHLLACPAHGATFDPARDGAVVQGVPQEPPIGPLSKVAVQINADGMIVAGVGSQN